MLYFVSNLIDNCENAMPSGAGAISASELESELEFLSSSSNDWTSEVFNITILLIQRFQRNRRPRYCAFVSCSCFLLSSRLIYAVPILIELLSDFRASLGCRPLVLMLIVEFVSSFVDLTKCYKSVPSKDISNQRIQKIYFT